MQTVQFQIKGVSPLMMSAEAPYEENGGKTAPNKKAPTPIEQAKSHLHVVKANGRGELAVLPAINLQKSFAAAYTFMPGQRKGWKKITNGCVMVEPLHLPIEPQSWTVDARRTTGVGGRGSGAVNYRPRFDAWSVKGTLKYDDRFISEEEVRSLVDMSGQFIGVGSWRVQSGGPYGRFIVTSWKSLS